MSLTVEQRDDGQDDLRAMTAEALCATLLEALLKEIRILPKPWQQTPQAQQQEIIDRLRRQVLDASAMAVHCLVTAGRAEVQGNLEQITIKDGIKAVVQISRGQPNFLELCEAAGHPVLLIIAGKPGEKGLAEIKAEPDQRGLDLGAEYTDRDGDGMDADVAVWPDDRKMLTLADVIGPPDNDGYDVPPGDDGDDGELE